MKFVREVLLSQRKDHKRRETPIGWITLQEAGRRLRVPGETVRKRIEAGLLPGRKHGWYWIVDEAAVTEQVAPPGWIDVEEAAQITQVRPDTMIRWIQKKKVRGRKLGGRWFVEQAGLAAFRVPPGWINLAEASERWGVPRFKVRRWAQQGRVPAQRVGRIWYVVENEP